MKVTHLTSVLLGLAVLMLSGANASAMYHPTTGRFLQRDPGPGHTDLVRTGTVGAVAGGRLLPRDLMGAYADGLNLYQYARSSPGVGADPSGTIVIGLWGLNWLGLDPPLSGEAIITQMVNQVASEVGDTRTIAKSGTYFNRPDVERELTAWRKRLEAGGCDEQFVLFGFSDGGTTTWRVMRGPNEGNYKSAVTGERLYNPAYFGVIDMVRRFYLPIPVLDIFGEGPNTQRNRSTSSALNATLAGQPTIVENYRNDGLTNEAQASFADRLGPLGLAHWRGFVLKGVGRDLPQGNTYHRNILDAVSRQVVASAVDAYRNVKP